MTVPVVASTDGAAQTRALGASLAPLLVVGDVLLLSGELGAGKTVLVQGMADGLGLDGGITSPTFALVDEHHAPSGVRLLHVDVYRLEDPAEIVELGLAEEVDDGRTIAVIEWGEKAAEVLGGERLEIAISDGGTAEKRTFHMWLHGPGWEARRGRIHLAVKRLDVDLDSDGYDGVLG